MSTPTEPGYYWAREPGETEWMFYSVDSSGYVDCVTAGSCEGGHGRGDEVNLEWGPRIPSPDQLAVLTGPVRDKRTPPLRMVHRPCGTTLEDAGDWEESEGGRGDWYCRNCRVFSYDTETDLQHV